MTETVQFCCLVIRPQKGGGVGKGALILGGAFKSNGVLIRRGGVLILRYKVYKNPSDLESFMGEGARGGNLAITKQNPA